MVESRESGGEQRKWWRAEREKVKSGKLNESESGKEEKVVRRITECE